MSLLFTVPGIFQSPLIVPRSRLLTPAWQYAFQHVPQAVGLLTMPAVRPNGLVDDAWLTLWGELGASAALLKTPLVTMPTGRVTGEWQRFLQHVDIP